jgi:A/G-specific adenine glycosylase
MAVPGWKRSQQELLAWWQENKREYPWRNTKDPYHILVSEVLLHRTKADQVVFSYKQLVRKFKNVKNLANASEAEVEKLLHSVGLHWRTKLLPEMAREITKLYKGEIPSESGKLESLPGISHYISSAVRCFAFGYPEVLLDTNTVRILGRIFGIKVTDGSRRSKQFRELYGQIIDKTHPREFNYAMIDLGALLCKPVNPQCDRCPLQDMCKYGCSKIGEEQ